jgi:hypothetical protein
MKHKVMKVYELIEALLQAFLTCTPQSPDGGFGEQYNSLHSQQSSVDFSVTLVTAQTEI